MKVLSLPALIQRQSGQAVCLAEIACRYVNMYVVVCLCVPAINRPPD